MSWICPDFGFWGKLAVEFGVVCQGIGMLFIFFIEALLLCFKKSPLLFLHGLLLLTERQTDRQTDITTGLLLSLIYPGGNKNIDILLSYSQALLHDHRDFTYVTFLIRHSLAVAAAAVLHDWKLKRAKS